MTDGSAYVYDGRRLLGSLKVLTNGNLEVFVADHNGDLAYIGKAASRREARELLREQRARQQGVPPETAAAA